MKFTGRQVVLVILIILLTQKIASEAAASEYKVEIFDHLCSEVNDEARYTSTKLKSLKYLTEGKNGFVFRSRDDFLENFGDEGSNYNGLKLLVDFLASKGTQLVMVYLPTRGLMNPYAAPSDRFDYSTALSSYLAKVEKLRQLGIVVPDMSSLLRQYQDTDFYFKRDIHWTPNSARKTAQLVAQTIKETGLIQPQSDYHYVSTPVGSYTPRGFMQKGIKQLCGGQYVEEYVQGYNYESSNETEGGALFADEPATEIVLLGTSFSALEQLNFAGFLQEGLGVPLENFSLPGGRDIGAWLSYIENGDFSAHPPKVIIWEVPGYYLLDNPMSLAQILPFIRGACEEQSVILENDLALTGQSRSSNALFFTQNMLDVPLSEIVLDFDFSDKEINDIRFNIWYSNGKVKKGRVNKPARANTGGRFVFSLYGHLLEPEGGVMSLELSGIEGQSVSNYLSEHGKHELNVHVKACRMPSNPIDN